jgi:hypothetical protein
MGYGTRHPQRGTPKIDHSWREQAKFKSEERADQRRGTPGFWHQNEPFKPIYIPGWMVHAERVVQEYAERENAPALIIQIGPFYGEA